MIEARRLHILRAVADHRTVTAAAAALYLTPSAVSQQLAALEQETGHRLVERGAKGVRLTPAGEILLNHTNAVLAQLERAEAELAAYSSGAAGTVTVASFATGIALVVAPAVTGLARSAPGIRIRVQDAEGDASLPMVLDRQVDVAVAVEYRGAPPQPLSLRWEGVTDRRNPLIRYVPWWVVGTAALVVLTVAFILYSSLLRSATTPVKLALTNLRTDAFNTTPVAAPAPCVSLRSLLSEEEANRAVAIAEQGGRTTITLPATDLFASARADVNPRYHDLLYAIATAINQVPGRVLVVGHTDSRRVRTYRFSDNLDLSRARADSVVSLMRARIDNAARLEANGVGDTQPLDPMDEARNRRVEIIHVRGS